MRIDRGRFLLLTSAVAAGACPTPVTPKGEPSNAASPKGSAKPTEAKVEARWTPDSEWWAEPYDPEYCVPAGGNWKPPAICTAPTASTCLSVGHPAACTLGATDACSATLAKACDRALERLSAPVVSFGVDCLASSTGICGGQGPEFIAGRCLVLATRLACADPSVDASCAMLAARCKNPWWPVESCRALFSGLSAKGRSQVTECMLGSACALGPAECLALR